MVRITWSDEPLRRHGPLPEGDEVLRRHDLLPLATTVVPSMIAVRVLQEIEHQHEAGLQNR